MNSLRWTGDLLAAQPLEPASSSMEKGAVRLAWLKRCDGTELGDSLFSRCFQTLATDAKFTFVVRFSGATMLCYRLNGLFSATQNSVICFAILGLATIASTAWGENLVGFDVPALVVAEEVDAAMVGQPAAGGRFVRLRFNVSTFVASDFRGAIKEYTVQLESPQQTMRVLDFWPRTQTYSDVAGSISVQDTSQTHRDLKLDVNGSFQPFATASLAGNMGSKGSHNQTYERKPPMQVLATSGTSHRGYGVFFKFHPGPVPIDEGAREVAMLLEVPQHWRGDMFRVTLAATGWHRRSSSASAKAQLLGVSRQWLAVHRYGDSFATAQVRRYIRQESALRKLAKASQARVEEKALPTVWHRMGAALDVVQPRIPTDYLDHVVFGERGQYLEGQSHRLPVDIRVAILDYWEQRDLVFDLASSATPAADSFLVSNRDRG